MAGVNGRLLIANRGEIAVRVIRAARDLGIETVAVYSQVDADAMHVSLADKAVCIGPAPAGQSYLDQSSIVAAALGTEADAVHPGYGFLAENASFAEVCKEEDLIFVGPSAHSISLAGNKVEARKAVAAAGVPVVPGSESALASYEEAKSLVDEIGLPLLIKARGGGGGRGMRIVRDLDNFESEWSEAAREAEAAFGDGGLYIERYLESVRHIEVQVFADSFGSTIALGERDCSVQRRHQKLIEEAPSPAVDAYLRVRLVDAAVAAARCMDYVGAGTVEFLFEPETGEFFFIEMNARIQVEHPVTEVLTGTDLVAEQIRVAAGEALSWGPGEITSRGHVIECRINAEDPDRDFAPSPGTITRFDPPGGPGVRVDTHCFTGHVVPPYYDSLLAKLIVHGNDRDHAIARMRRALSEFRVDGIKTTIPFHKTVLDDAGFVSGDINTRFIETMGETDDERPEADGA